MLSRLELGDAQERFRSLKQPLAIAVELIERPGSHQTLESALVDEFGVNAARKVGNADERSGLVANGNEMIHCLTAHALNRGQCVVDDSVLRVAGEVRF